MLKSFSFHKVLVDVRVNLRSGSCGKSRHLTSQSKCLHQANGYYLRGTIIRTPVELLPPSEEKIPPSTPFVEYAH
jgi:hypothetical protein